MKVYSIEWVTHHKKAGGTGSVNADNDEQAIEKAREIIAELNPLLTEDELARLEIKVTEVS